MSTEDNAGTLEQVLDGFNQHDLDAIMSISRRLRMGFSTRTRPVGQPL